MKTKLVALSVALLSCLAATSTKAGTDWSFSFGYSSGGVASSVYVAAPVRAPACVVPVPAPCAPIRRVAWVAPAPVVVAVPAPRPYVSCVAPVVVRPVPVCAPVVVVHGHRHHSHYGYRHGW